MTVLGENPGEEIVIKEEISKANGGTFDTGLACITSAALTPSDAAHIAAITAISGGTITIGLKDNANSAVDVAETIYAVIYGW